MLISNLDNVIKMNLQLLAGEGEEGNEQNPDDGGSEGGGEDPKTYTQEELDALQIGRASCRERVSTRV